MSELSDPTLGVLVDAGQELTVGDLKTLLMRVDLNRYGDQEQDKQELVRSRLIGARDAAKRGNRAARRSLVDFATELLARAVPDPEYPPQWFDELCEDLLADGLELFYSGERPDAIGQGTSHYYVRSAGTVRYELRPTDAAPVPLAGEITALEADLHRRGYLIALNHYQQAVDGLIHNNFESANGALRSALEDLVTLLAEDHAGFTRTPGRNSAQPAASQGGQAIAHLIERGVLPADEGGEMLRSLWRMCHTNGPHPGLSDADEARFRMQVVTATSRFLLKRFSR